MLLGSQLTLRTTLLWEGYPYVLKGLGEQEAWAFEGTLCSWLFLLFWLVFGFRSLEGAIGGYPYVLDLFCNLLLVGKIEPYVLVSMFLLTCFDCIRIENCFLYHTMTLNIDGIQPTLH